MWDSLEGVLQDQTSLTPKFAVVNPVYHKFSPHLISCPQKKAQKQITYIYRILFNYVANNDIQIY